MSDSTAILRLGTRGSLLARTQSEGIARALERAHPGSRVELVLIKTTGDRIVDRPLTDAGGKGLFVKELEQALLAGEVDFAVHSMKDVPVTMPLTDQSDLIIAAVPVRANPSDVLISPVARTLAGLPRGARVGTSSSRRRCQVLDVRNDLTILPLRGNVDTRLRKVQQGEYDAIVLAYAGLERLGLIESSQAAILPELLSAPGQGALALQCRRSDEATRSKLAALNDVLSARCVQVERDVVQALHGDCHSPIAAMATIDSSRAIRLKVAVGATDGNLPVYRAESTSIDIASVVQDVVQQLAKQGYAINSA